MFEILRKMFVLISGMFQRIDKMRKNAFGSMCIFGEDNKSQLEGIWVWKGTELAFEVNVISNLPLGA